MRVAAWTRWRREWLGLLSLGAVISVITLAWIGYHAVAEWQRSAELLVQRAADSGADLLTRAITRDMRAVQSTVLPSLQFEHTRADALIDVNAVASAFARYPYPEDFFGARLDGGAGQLTFYARANRLPPWLPASDLDTPFPVFIASVPQMSSRILTRIAVDARDRKTLSVFDEEFEGVLYQVVALLGYPDSSTSRLDSVRGFMVNLDWVRRNYFHAVTTQIGLMAGNGNGLHFSVIDPAGTIRARTADGTSSYLTSEHQFPMLFFEPEIIALDPPGDLRQERWTAQAAIADSRDVLAVRSGTRVTLIVTSISALALAVGLALSAKATLARTRLADMRSDFTAAVTHDLKTPIATIRAIGESFLVRADVDQSTRRDYGRIVLHEAKRLTRLIDNLLAYSRISDITEAYTFRAESVPTLIRRTYQEFSFQLDAIGFSVHIDVPAALPSVRADATSLGLALGNLFDNAIRYSEERKQLSVRARATTDGLVIVEIADAGIGIPENELAKVTHKFFRGAGTVAGGSGLGLAIAERIVSDHGGALSISSRVGRGTTVTVTLEAA